MQKIIIGGGLAGLLAACHFKDAEIHEAGDEIANHRALLRFRDKGVSELTGIPFRDVEVRKGIYTAKDHTFHDRCNIKLANLYSRKVVGEVMGRSIWNLDPVTRYVAPPDLYERLVKMHRDRIYFNLPAQTIWQGQSHATYINTAPLPVIAKIAIGFQMDEAIEHGTQRASIRVDRFKVANCDVHQTIYFPEEDLRVYRASITGDTLIVEYIADANPENMRFSSEDSEVDFAVCAAFGLDRYSLKLDGTVDQQYGKIVDLSKDVRQAALYELTRDYGIYSLGRFATWRNILLDDVVKDIRVIDGLIKASDYGRFRNLARVAGTDDGVPF